MMAHVSNILFHQYAQVRFKTAQLAGDSNPNGQKIITFFLPLFVIPNLRIII